MELVMPFIVALAALAFVGYPLFRPREEAEAAPVVDERMEKLRGERENVLTALSDLEFDHGLGNLSEPDYRDLRQGYRHRALAILKELDEVSSEQAKQKGATERTSAGQAQRRDRIAVPAETPVPASAPSRRGGAACPQCGGVFEPEDKFCARCGGALNMTCSGCGHPYHQGDKFCARCGATLG